MKVFKDVSTIYYKYVTEQYSSGNAGYIEAYWDEYRAGTTGATKYMQYPTIITSVRIQIGPWADSFRTGYVCNIILQASQNGSTWVNVKGFGDRSGCGTTHTLDCSDNTTSYRYYRLYAENGGWGGEDSLRVSSIEYIGTYTMSVESTPQDYDYITQTQEYCVFVINSDYYAIRSWNKGEYYGT